MYVPRDEAFEESKMNTFTTSRLKAVLHNLLPSLIASISADNRDFKGFADIDRLYKGKSAQQWFYRVPIWMDLVGSKLLLLKEKLLDSQCKSIERSEAACVLANIPMSDNEVKTVLGPSLVHFMVTSLKGQLGSSAVGHPRASPSMLEGLLGLLLKFSRNPDPSILETVKEQPLMDVFLDQLRLSSKPRVKQRAALGLKHLSESASTVVCYYLERNIVRWELLFRSK